MADEHDMGSLARVSLISALRKGVRSARLHAQTLVHCKSTVGLTRALRGAFLLCNIAFLKLRHHFCSFLGLCLVRALDLVVFYMMLFEVQIKCGCNLKGLIIKNMIVLLFCAGNVYNANAYNIV